MINFQNSHRNLFAIFIGFLVIVFIGIISSAISFPLISHLFRNLATENLSSIFSTQPYLIVSWTLMVIFDFFPVILGGIVVGWIVREKGWVYGGILGIVLTIVSIGVVSLTFVLPPTLIYGQNVPHDFGRNLAQKNISNQFFQAPLTILLTSLSGLLGERLYNQSTAVKKRHKIAREKNKNLPSAESCFSPCSK